MYDVKGPNITMCSKECKANKEEKYKGGKILGTSQYTDM
jgi:hypothetical protein